MTPQPDGQDPPRYPSRSPEDWHPLRGHQQQLRRPTFHPLPPSPQPPPRDISYAVLCLVLLLLIFLLVDAVLTHAVKTSYQWVQGTEPISTDITAAPPSTILLLCIIALLLVLLAKRP